MRRAACCIALTFLAACDNADQSPTGTQQVVEVANTQPAPPPPTPAVEFTQDELRTILRMSPVPDPPPDPTNKYADDERAAALGHYLYFDTRLSANDTVSCATCHDPKFGLADQTPLAAGLGLGPRHSIALFNTAHHPWFNWDGRADTLWSQATRPLTKDVEMGATPEHIAQVIADNYRDTYQAIFGPLDRTDPVRVMVNAAKSIAAYERKFVFADAPLDRFVLALRNDPAGDINALSPDAQRGLKLFIGRANCVACHAGPTFSDGAFHSARIAPGDGPDNDAGRFAAVDQLKADPFSARSEYSDAPEGPTAQRLEYLTRTSADFGRFKTPTLRNVAQSAPYMHQGQKKTLRDVIAHYSTFDGALPPAHNALDGQEMLLRPLHLNDSEAEQLLAFLESLTSPPRFPQWMSPPE
ncbi:MAG: c-type cytochrome [Phycisphaerales bacterium]|nr:c-type cytochrome [Phycisphaerales bacterium]